VFGVPIPNGSLNGVDAVWSILQMPAGVPVGTLAIGKAGAINAALLAAATLAFAYPAIATALATRRANITAAVIANPDPRQKN
jgi:5-(carboxyamino)imidazole ribonucleotide mutase